MASKETRFKSKISIQCGYCKISMRRDRLSEHTRQQHPGLPIKERGQTSLIARDVAAAPQTPQLRGAQANFGGPS